MTTMKTAKAPSDIPSGHHYAILVFKSQSVFIPGDERSRTHPGHGYPERTENYDTFEYHFTEDKEEWVNEIQTRERVNRVSVNYRQQYAAIEVAAKASIKMEVVVGVSTNG